MCSQVRIVSIKLAPVYTCPARQLAVPRGRYPVLLHAAGAAPPPGHAPSAEAGHVRYSLLTQTRGRLPQDCRQTQTQQGNNTEM